MAVSEKSVSWTSTFVMKVLQQNRRLSDVTLMVHTFWTHPYDTWPSGQVRSGYIGSGQVRSGQLRPNRSRACDMTSGRGGVRRLHKVYKHAFIATLVSFLVNFNMSLVHAE